MPENLAAIGTESSLTWNGHDPHLSQAIEDLRTSGWMENADWHFSMIGKGGCGTVYRVTRVRNGVEEHIAIKTAANDEERALLANERAMMARVAAAPRCLNAETDAPYIMMEHIAGRSLEQTSFQGADAKVRVQLCRATVEAIHRILQSNIIHADIKPPNIMIDQEGALRILDFGTAVDAPPPHTRKHIGTLRGTPLYMAPEQWDGEVDRHTDVFAAGCLLYHELSGHDIALEVTGGNPSPLAIANAMHQKDTDGTIHDVIAASHLPMRHLLERMLRLDPERRPDCEDIVASLWKMYCKVLRKSPGLVTMLASQPTEANGDPTVLVAQAVAQLPATQAGADPQRQV